MKNLLFFAFLFVFTSCAKEQIVVPQNSETPSVAVRSTAVESVGDVVNFEIIIDELILQMADFNVDISNLSLLEFQTVELQNNATGEIERFPIRVSSYEIIIDELILQSVAPTINWSNYIVAPQQNLLFGN